MPAELVRHLECLAAGSAVTRGWTIDSASLDSRSYAVDVHPPAEPRSSSGKEEEFDP
jgi:hypothetical protein